MQGASSVVCWLVSVERVHTATHCNTLQHTATHCNTLQHTATRCNTLQHTATRIPMQCASSVVLGCWLDSMLKLHTYGMPTCSSMYGCCVCVAARHSVLQCVAVCCSVLQCVAVRCSVFLRVRMLCVCCSASQCVAVLVTVCCSVLQCVAACCSALQRVPPCTDSLCVLQRVTVCCSVLQCLLQRVAACCSATHKYGAPTCVCVAARGGGIPVCVLQRGVVAVCVLQRGVVAYQHTRTTNRSYSQVDRSFAEYSLFHGLFCKRDL